MSFPYIKRKYGKVDGTEVFSILIPTWNNLPHLMLIVESIRKNSTFKHQIILHINEGKDGSLTWADAQEDVFYTSSDANIGICKAMNLAATLATTAYILYINDDMYVCPQWDLHLHNEIKAIGHHYFFLSSTMIEHYDSGNACVIVANYGNTIETFEEERLLGTYDSYDKNNWSGSTWPPNVVHKEVWDMVGGYSIEFSPGMYSDPDFSRKLWHLGVRIFKGVGASRVYHFGSKSTKRIKVNTGRAMFLKKWDMTARTFSKIFLRSGQPYVGILPEVELSKLQRILSYFKRL
ncbi:MAG TPA: glycosyltransferase [Cytophagales bacterium]|nr:glycosyltransferase [Cytophagales bacterium]